MKAIVDCDSFYCSCERVFKPELKHKAIVVLSNNDGCIISRNAEAKALGIGMATPYYQLRELIEKNQVAIFSSNYNLYGDMSQRVMAVLKMLAGEDKVEVYSVDESFLDLSHIAPESFESFALQIKATVEQYTGVPVSIGIAITKTLCKVANRFSKKTGEGVTILDNLKKINVALENTKVEDVWGVGRQSAVKLKQQNILSAVDLKNINIEWARKSLGGVVGVRLVKELNGLPCIPMKEPLEVKKMISTTRMFGRKVVSHEELREAVSSYVARAAEKLRRQACVAGSIRVFLVTANTNKNIYAPESLGLEAKLPVNTSVTSNLLQYGLPLVDRLYKPGHIYLKAGVILSDIVSENTVQQNLFTNDDAECKKELMRKMDNINFSMRNEVIRFASAGFLKKWRMRQDFISPRYTSRWEELKEVN